LGKPKIQYFYKANARFVAGHFIKKLTELLMSQIKNAVGTANETCKCATWLDHWKKFSGQTPPTYCVVDKCYHTDLVGAHVKVVGWNTVYILPLCKEHNQSTETMSVPDGWKLVPANKKETCDR
jgi:hypothetical protein